MDTHGCLLNQDRQLHVDKYVESRFITILVTIVPIVITAFLDFDLFAASPIGTAVRASHFIREDEQFRTKPILINEAPFHSSISFANVILLF